MNNIFFSYSRVDGSDFALRLASDLKKAGANVWIDQLDIPAGKIWDIEIEKALEKAGCIIYIATGESTVSKNVLNEVYYALDNDKEVIPILATKCKIPFRLQRLQYIDFTKNYASGLERLLTTLSISGIDTAVTKTGDGGRKWANKKIFAITGIIVLLAIFILLLFKFNFNAPGTNISSGETARTSNPGSYNTQANAEIDTSVSTMSGSEQTNEQPKTNLNKEPNIPTAQGQKQNVANDTVQRVDIKQEAILTPLELARSFNIKTSSPVIKVRYKYKDVDTAYDVPEDFTFEELKALILRHFYKEELKNNSPLARYVMYVNRKKVDQFSTLKKSGVKNNDRVTIDQITTMVSG